jgi:prohibitin 2
MKFNKVTGLRPEIYREGYHLKLPWFEKQIIYSVKTQSKDVKTVTGSKDLQEVRVNLRVLYRVDQANLRECYRFLGMDYDDRVLPSLVNEVLKSTIAQYNAASLLAQREQVSGQIRMALGNRLKEFHILLDDVSITDLVFGQEFTKAIEEKQIAQQQAERAKYVVMKAVEDKKSTIIKAQGEAMAAEAFGKVMASNPAYIDLRRIEAAREIATKLGGSRNKVYLDSDSLLLNLTSGLDQNLEKRGPVDFTKI